MKHVTEDKILEYALEIIESDDERSEIESHFRSCPDCRERLRIIQGDIEIMGGVKGPSFMVLKPAIGRRQFWFKAIASAAALLFIGFLSGLGISSLTHRETVNVLPSYIELSAPPDSLMRIAVPDGTQINQVYF